MGIGAALVLDGALRRGASGGAGEIGFLPVPGTTGLPSATGCDGGFHSLAAAGAIAALAKEHGVTATAVAHEPYAAALVRAAVTRAADGVRREALAEGGPVASHSHPDPAADRFLDVLADRVALGAAAVISVLDPGCVVLAGEIGRAGGDTLAGRVQGRLAGLSPLPTEVRSSALGGGAVLRGALLTARDRAQDDLFAPRRAR
ncbi:ROK family transcriptional regulator OS=Streptomyces alboniger OX=132473 GN=CP975_05375 PE=3 SV=1 [Streptomyces alboniger]